MFSRIATSVSSDSAESPVLQGGEEKRAAHVEVQSGCLANEKASQGATFTGVGVLDRVVLSPS